VSEESTPTIRVSGSALRTAREAVHLSPTEAARRVGKVLGSGEDCEGTQRRIRDFEADREEPTLAEIEALATVYLVPFSSIVTGTPNGSPRRDFRRIAGSGAAPLSYETLGRLHRFDQFYEVASRLATATSSTEDIAIPAREDWNPRDPSSGEALGSQIRKHLGVSDQVQRNWDSDEESHAFWIAAIEKAGVFVFRQGMDVTDLRGASRWDTGGPPAILINTSDTVVAQTFTALHEFAHLVARAHDATNVCDISEPRGNEERFANRAAGSALLPESLIRRALSRIPLQPNYRDWPRQDRQKLRDASGVSHQVIGIRLEQLKLVEDSGYSPFWRKKSGFGRGKPLKRWQRARRYVGPRTKTLARRALAEERIQTAELARMLELKLSEVEQLVES
jgi:Zn-dependent peptidase ImmA (M78 family)